jgi:hypothetical protein
MFPFLSLISSFNLWFVGALALAWIVVYFAWLRPWLRTYQRTAGIMAVLEADEAKGFGWICLKLKGAGSAILLFVTSIVTGGWGLVEALFGVDPSALAPFQDSQLWKGLLHDEMALKAAAIATFAGAVLVLRGKLHDVKIVPVTPAGRRRAASDQIRPHRLAARQRRLVDHCADPRIFHLQGHD